MTSEEGHRIHKYTHQNIFKGVRFYIFMQNRLGTYSFFWCEYISKENAQEWEPGDIFC